MRDRVARHKNQQQDRRLDSLDSMVNEIAYHIEEGAIAELFSRVAALEAAAPYPKRPAKDGSTESE